MAAVVYLSLGSNSEDPVDSVISAIDSVLSLGGVKPVGMGSFYETEPQGKTDQPWFVNTVIAVSMDFSPEETLQRLKDIEKSMGRTPGERWGPREIDIDIIFFGGVVMNTPDLTIPHPRAHERRFVLRPLADISPDVVHPTLKTTVGQLLEKIPEQGQTMRKIDP